MTAIRHLILAAFEPDAGPVPGELRYFIEREALMERLPLAAGYRPVWFNPQRAILACATGVGAARAAASVMALGLDSRFNLSGAQVLITGVAGIDPARGSLASVALPEFVVDGDLTHEIDAREIPAEWPDGFVPIGKSVPYEQPLASRFNGDDGILFQLDARSVTRAFQVASQVKLLDTPAIARRRLLFSPAATAHQPPHVLRGDELASSTFWHGQLLSQRAQRWVAYQSGGRARYAITAMEDAGMLQALKSLAAAGRVDFSKVVIARAASNFDQQRAGITTAESLAETRVATDSAYLPALGNAWRVGHALIEADL
jgi:purine nucleoside permease